MSARKQLFEAYDEWRELTWAEGEAIRTDAWEVVNRCQMAKKRLQTSIMGFTQEAMREIRDLGQSQSDFQRELRAQLQELIILENRNGEVLTQRMEETKSRQAELESSTRNLRRVRSSYVTASEGCWQSYS